MTDFRIPSFDPADVADPAARARLDELTRQAREIILARQDPDTGLLPASTAITVHGDYTHAWVRDNVYSIMAIWALAHAWRARDAAQAAELDARVIHLMRGLLAAMMRQSAKVERFKHTQHPLDALHAKYSTRSGEPVVGRAIASGRSATGIGACSMRWSSAISSVLRFSCATAKRAATAGVFWRVWPRACSAASSSMGWLARSSCTWVPV